MALEHVWHDVPLNLSFRSTEPVLAAVDAVFAQRPAADGLIFDDGAASSRIMPFRTGQAGLVELGRS